ncbi:hypothetical protein TNCV_4687931 [Trichonephila clavipes]|nr:hypothetical protein TNCV_4687931 [Trichonephila clavipes]
MENKLLACGNTKNESKFVPVSSVSMPSSPVPLNAATVSVKLSIYDGKTNWEVYKIQFSIISEANGWTEEGDVQKAVRMADVQDLKSALLYALKLRPPLKPVAETANPSRRDIVTLDAPLNLHG